MADRLRDMHSDPPISESDRTIIDAKSRERSSAVSFLRDTVGCLVRETSIPHLQQAIADRIEILCDSTEKRIVVRVNCYDLSHTVTGFQFKYFGQRDFPICALMFKPRVLAIDCDAPVFREDEHLMRAGIVLEAQSDDTRLLVKASARDQIPSLAIDYTEDRLALNIGGTDLSHVATGFVVGANFVSGAVSLGSLGLRFQ